MRPWLAKLPISSLFLVSTLMTRIAYLQELLSHTTNVVKLAVAVRMHCARQALAVGDQAKAQLAQQPTDCGATDPVCLCGAAEMQSCARLSFTHFCSSVGEPAMSSLTISLILSSIAGLFFPALAAHRPACAPGRLGGRPSRRLTRADLAESC